MFGGDIAFLLRPLLSLLACLVEGCGGRLGRRGARLRLVRVSLAWLIPCDLAFEKVVNANRLAVDGSAARQVEPGVCVAYNDFTVPTRVFRSSLKLFKSVNNLSSNTFFKKISRNCSKKI